jgi:hypothetical protein
MTGEDMTNQQFNKFDSEQFLTYKWVITSVFILIAFAILSYFSPYFMLYSFCEAATKKQVVALNNLIDFPILKENLKVQALSSAADQFQGDLTQQSSPWTAMGVAIGASVVSTTVDTLTTPAVFDAAIFQKVQSNLSPLQIFANMLANQQGNYESWDTFVMQSNNTGNAQPQIAFTLGRTGPFSWKLNNIKIENSKAVQVAQNESMATAQQESLAATQGTAPVTQEGAPSSKTEEISLTPPKQDSTALPNIEKVNAELSTTTLASNTATVLTSSRKDPVDIINHLLQEQCSGNDSAIDSSLPDLELMKKPVPGNGTEATRLNKVGLKYLKDKDYGEAIKFFGWAANADASDPKYLSNLGFAEMQAGNLDSAKQHLFISIAMAPSRSVAWGDLGENFAKQRDQEKAVACFLIGYKVSGGDTLGFLQSLKDDDDPAIREAGNLALIKVGSVAKAGTL